MDVLVIGCGPAGLTATLALARQGVRVLAVTKHRQLAPTPRAHVTNQRSFEILRDFGLEDKARALATDYAHMQNVVFLYSLTGQEYGRIAGVDGDPVGGNVGSSPCKLADLPQHLLEPFLLEASLNQGAHVRFSTELLSFTQDEHGVTAELKDRLSGEQIQVRAKYMIGADGGRSAIARALDLPFEGHGELGTAVGVLFECDLAEYVAHRSPILSYFMRTAEDAIGQTVGILRCVKPWTSWQFVQGYAVGHQIGAITQAEAIQSIREFLRIPELPIKVTGIDPWAMNSMWATNYQAGRVFCMGDAVHRHVPSNGLGSNTGIQDAYNLAWKLAYVLQGKADASLLESYSEERVPVGRKVVERATKSLGTYQPIHDMVCTLKSSETALAGVDDPTPAGREWRRKLRALIHDKRYEYHTRGFELNQLYRSSAIVDEGQELSQETLDREIFYHLTTCPGARLPHAWVQQDRNTISTLDLVGKGRFSVITGVGGEAWLAAAETAGARFGVDIAGIQIGLGCAINDYLFEWTDRREIEEDGCLLVRPDGHIAWRRFAVAGADPEASLMEALTQILGHAPDATERKITTEAEDENMVVPVIQ